MTTQQRRSFFQTVGPLKRQQRIERTEPRASLSLATVILTALLFLTSCASLTPDRVALLTAIATQAAQVGVSEWLAKHPTQREAWAIAISAFANSVRKGDTNAVEYLNSLPTATLAGPEGALYVTGSRLVVWDEVVGKPYVLTNLPPIVSALKRGLAELPPMPPQRIKRSPYTLELNPGVPTNAALTDAELDAQFERVKAKLAARTNTTCTVDVQPQPNGASVVTVRWTARPGVYQVQQRDEGSVDWVAFGTVTNAGEWRTGWHPSLPVGHWRVIRQAK